MGIRYSISDFSKYQVEFRQPFGEQWYFRLGADLGKHDSYYDNKIISAFDSAIVIREKHYTSNFAQLRFGFQRDLKWNHFSIYSDVPLSYSTTNHMRWNYMREQDSLGNWNFPTNSDNNNIQLICSDNSTASNKYIGTGISLGLSYAFPVSDHFIIGINASANTLFLFAAGHTETNDVYNEYVNLKEIVFDFYPNTGLALRYYFGKSEK